ncbi:phosphate/phosphite/phosphonate ABC transporter substrate-binding protein [Roseomonas xinghualingensis]|uniref:phosphate/phosphite/phosphonate ABC transporter substrate-binding protein n=1 Tax=Roseomonas xinghualingensis TaxID=2986475 RepID=UPI0021F0EA8B|nr:phosphate/phosphite/phosphonate ABC transporter substrate-binding protein [Roseomonas sp. SXEYE001]MCV4210257.1 phosphate/phosphite/phosphonate ABC transporter substrate-binding protein [Roseomonas sp. SXEYE001]
MKGFTRMKRRHALALPFALAALPARAQRRSADAGIAFPAPGRRGWAAQVPQIRIGLIGGENEADRLGRYDAYRRLLEETFGVSVRLFPASDYAGVVQAFSAGQLDLAAVSPAVYAAAWIDTNGDVEPLLVAEQEDGSISYVGVMVVRADSGITDIAGMRGRSLAWPDPNSASGYLIPRFALRRAGIDPNSYFSRTGFAGGHEQAVVAVLQRQYDAAFTWASEQGDPKAGYSRGNLHTMVAKGMLDMRDLRIVWHTEPVIYGPLMARKSLPDAFKEDLRLFHLALPRAHPEIYRSIERGAGTGYREVGHEAFQLLIDMRREEAAERRRRN